MQVLAKHFPEVVGKLLNNNKEEKPTTTTTTEETQQCIKSQI